MFGINYVLHCIDGSFEENRNIFEHIYHALTENGVLFGATLINDSWQNTRVSRLAMQALNALGIFLNHSHQVLELEQVLHNIFRRVKLTILGNAIVFQAWK